ncbi:MAG: ATP-binding cassette domain-containing protein [Lachnospiraceae bacterium]|nr:ATP-binding cassette domain-containing protein [Lachnospiraceae bacterium]
MSEAVIALNGIEKAYGSHKVLKGVDMQVNKGDIYGLVGKNGAGKTTLFKVILGLSTFEGGKLSIMGGKNENENRKARRKIGFFVGANFFGYMNARGNLDYYRRLKGIKDKSEIDRVLEIVNLTGDAAKVPAKRYSLGMKQRLGIANSLLGNPEIIIMDEPTNGLDPQGIADVRNLIQRINEEQGTTIIVSSHILSELEHTAHRFGIVHEGVLMREISQDEMKNESKITTIDIDTEYAEKAKEILGANGVPIKKIDKKTFSLEDFYFGMIGGEGNK